MKKTCFGKKLIGIISVLMSVMILFGATACKRNKEPGVLEINFTIAGYGEKYVTELVNAFTEETGIKVRVTKDDNATNSAIGRITAYKTATTDLYVAMVSDFDKVDSCRNRGGYDNLVKELSDLYEMQVPGKGKTLKELVRKDLYNASTYFDIKTGKAEEIYSVPWTSSIEGFIVNMKVLEKYGITDIPRTTDEFEEVLDIIKSGRTANGAVVPPKDRVRGGITCANNSAYWHFVWPTWWAQYDGLEAIDAYFAAKPANAGDGMYIPDWQALESDGKLAAIEETYRFLNKDRGYMDPDSENESNEQTQVSFLDGKSAFIPSGSWIETETALDFYEEGADISFKMMKTPVISKLGEKLGITEEELRAAIDYADGKGEKPALSDAVLEKVAAARGIASSGLTCQNKIMIPAYSPELESAYKFVLFYASDKAQEILVKYGIMSSFGYKSPANNNNTEFVNSMFEILDRDDTVLLIPGTKYPMAYKAQLDYTAHSLFTSAQKGFENLIYNGTKTAQDIYNDEMSYFQDRWSQMLTNAGYRG